MPTIMYQEVGEQYWVTEKLGYVQAIRLSPSGSGEPYKGKGIPQGYLILHRERAGEEVDADQDIGFLGLNELFEGLAELQALHAAEIAELVKDLPFKKTIDLTPIVQDEIKNALNQFDWEPGSDLNVEVVLEDNLELVVRIGLA